MIKLSCMWCCISPCILYIQPHLESNKVWTPHDQGVWTLILQSATQLKYRDEAVMEEHAQQSRRDGFIAVPFCNNRSSDDIFRAGARISVEV